MLKIILSIILFCPIFCFAANEYEQIGSASWYGKNFQGKITASGEIYDINSLTAAHPTLPLLSMIEVTNLENGKVIIVKVNDRGPFFGKRIIDLSQKAAEELSFSSKGIAKVKIKYLY